MGRNELKLLHTVSHRRLECLSVSRQQTDAVAANHVQHDRDVCVLVNQMNAVHCSTCRNEM
jgi:hypothetical protein